MGIDHTPWDFGITGKKKKSSISWDSTWLGLFYANCGDPKCLLKIYSEGYK